MAAAAAAAALNISWTLGTQQQQNIWVSFSNKKENNAVIVGRYTTCTYTHTACMSDKRHRKRHVGKKREIGIRMLLKTFLA